MKRETIPSNLPGNIFNPGQAENSQDIFVGLGGHTPPLRGTPLKRGHTPRLACGDPPLSRGDYWGILGGLIL